MNALHKILKAFGKHSVILWACIIFFTVIISLFCITKYERYDYNGIDLAIFSQVFFNSAQGNWFDFSIHPHSYLGDHFGIIIILLLPLYLLAPSPITLLILQTLFVALTAWPLFLLARSLINSRWALVLSLVFLFNPFVLNLLFFEFHLLPFAMFFLAWVFYFFHKKKYFPFIIFLMLSLLVREDVALVVLMIGVVAWINKRRLRWIIGPLLLGLAWIVFVYLLSGHFNTTGEYKFLTFYSWLGQTPSDIAITVATKPWLLIQKLFSWHNIILAVGMLLPVLGLPLLRPKYLIPAILVALQLMLIGTSNTIVLETHYSSLLLIILYIATIFSIAKIYNKQKPLSCFCSFLNRYQAMLAILLVAGTAYSACTFSPLLPAIKYFARDNEMYLNREKDHLVAPIPNDATVVAGFEFLPSLSQRTSLYSLHYAFLGKQQFSDLDYTIPQAVDNLLVNSSDFIIYQIQSQNITSYEKQYPSGYQRIQTIIDKNNLGLASAVGTLLSYHKKTNTDITLYQTLSRLPDTVTPLPQPLGDNLQFLGYEKRSTDHSVPENIFPFSLFWSANSRLASDYQLLITVLDDNKTALDQMYYPLGYGMYPTHSWPSQAIIQTNYWFYLSPQYQKKATMLQLEVVATKGYMSLNRLRTVEYVITDQNVLGPPIALPLR